jgi:hypothetical protein
MKVMQEQQKAVKNRPIKPLEPQNEAIFQQNDKNNFTRRRSAVDDRSPTELGRFRTTAISPVALPQLVLTNGYLSVRLNLRFW